MPIETMPIETGLMQGILPN